MPSSPSRIPFSSDQKADLIRDARGVEEKEGCRGDFGGQASPTLLVTPLAGVGGIGSSRSYHHAVHTLVHNFLTSVLIINIPHDVWIVEKIFINI
jgi:hypothetical protein